jgi:hypothetical protein
MTVRLVAAVCKERPVNSGPGGATLADHPDPVPDEIWAEAARHFDEPALAGLVLAIANQNLWNRLNVATRQVAGECKPDAAGKWKPDA